MLKLSGNTEFKGHIKIGAEYKKVFYVYSTIPDLIIIDLITRIKLLGCNEYELVSILIAEIS